MNELEALSLAIQREKEAHRYYSDAAAGAASESGRKMFSWLASEEMGHIRILEKQAEELKAKNTWLSEEGYCSYGDISHPIECSEFPSSAEVTGEPEADAPELEILKQAIGAERKATSYYAGLAGSTSDPNGRAMFEKLSRVEQGHLDLLEEEYDYLKKAKTPFTIHRFSLPPS